MSLNLSQMKVIRFILLSEIFLCQKFPDSKCQFSLQALALKNTSIKLEKMHRTDVYHKLFIYLFFYLYVLTPWYQKSWTDVKTIYRRGCKFYI